MICLRINVGLMVCLRNKAMLARDNCVLAEGILLEMLLTRSLRDCESYETSAREGVVPADP